MKSQMRLTRTSGSVGGLGGRPPRSTRPVSVPLAAVTLAVQIVHGARSIVEDLKVLFGAVKDLAKELQVRQVLIPVGLEKKAIGDLTDEDYQIIETEIATPLQADSS